MILPPRKRKQLTAFLGSLPNAAAVKLFAALETDRSRGGDDLPHDALLDDLRRRMLERGALFPVRKPGAKRIFFTPFEDFFIGARSGKKRRGMIARASLDPIWRVMMTESETMQAAFAAASLDDALEADEDTEILERSMFIAAEAGLSQLCTRAADDRDTRERLIAELGGKGAFRDLLEIRVLLQGVEFLKQLHATIVSNAPALDEEQYYELRKIFLSAYDQSPAAGAYVLLALKGRLERPWRALGVYYHLAQGADDRLRAARETVSVLPESLFEDIEVLARSLERDCAGALDAETSMMRVGYFADYAEGLIKKAKKIGDNVYINRIEACRDIAGEAHDRFAEQALAALRETMPVRHAGGSSRLMPLRPDVARPLSAQTVNEARSAARLIAMAAATAERLCVDPGFSAAIADQACESMHAYIENLVAEIRAAEGEERKAARRMMDYALTIAEPLLTSDETGLIRDRAAAAAMTA